MTFIAPAAVAASLRHPQRQVVCLVGDGGFLMTGSELAVAIERTYRVSIPDEKVGKQAFASVAALADYVASHR